MRKLILVLLLLVMSAGLIACAGGDEKAKEIFTKAYEAAEEMQSAEVSINMNQQITIGDSAMDISTDMEGEVIADPMALHQKGKMTMNMDETPMEMEMEMYLADNEFYMYDGMMGQWFKVDQSMMDLYTNQQELADQLEMFEDYVGDFSLEEADGHYQLQLTMDSKAVGEMFDSIIADYMPEDMLESLGEEGTKLLDSMEVTHLFYELTVDKNTYETKEYRMEIETTMDVDGEEMKISIDMNGTYDNINGIDKIEIPAEVKEEAIEQPF